MTICIRFLDAELDKADIQVDWVFFPLSTLTFIIVPLTLLSIHLVFQFSGFFSREEYRMQGEISSRTGKKFPSFTPDEVSLVLGRVGVDLFLHLLEALSAEYAVGVVLSGLHTRLVE
jgi:hypothetical protein